MVSKWFIIVSLLLTCWSISTAQPVKTSFLVNDKTELRNIQRMVIYTNGAEKQLENILQDALSVGLTQTLHFTIADRQQLEIEVTKDFQTKQKKAEKDSSEIIPLSLEQIAASVGANHYLVIDYTIAKKQYSNEVKGGSETSEKIVISSLSFRIFKIGMIQPLTIGVIDFLLGESPAYAANAITELIEKMSK